MGGLGFLLMGERTEFGNAGNKKGGEKKKGWEIGRGSCGWGV